MMDLETKEIPYEMLGFLKIKPEKNRSEKRKQKKDKTPKISSRRLSWAWKALIPQIEIAKGQYSARGDWNNVLVEEVIQNFLWRILWRQYRIYYYEER